MYRIKKEGDSGCAIGYLAKDGFQGGSRQGLETLSQVFFKVRR
jgi:hypothetical protein